MKVALSQLSDVSLKDHARALGRQSAEVTTELICAIAEVDARKSYADDACSSMHAWCCRELAMSDGQAYTHIRVARLCRLVPAVLDAIAAQRLSPCGARVLASALTADNAELVLADVAGMSTRDIERYARTLDPRPDVRPSIRRRPSQPSETGGSGGDLLAGTPEKRPAPRRKPAPRPEPIREDAYKVTFMASPEFVAKFEEARALLSHSNPGADIGQIMTMALDSFVEIERKKRRAALSTPSTPSKGSTPTEAKPAAATAETRHVSSRPEIITDPSPDRALPGGERPETRSRTIPAAIRRAVWERDEGRCTFVDSRGRRCDATHFLELHHVEPWARGGVHSEDNIRLACSCHNALAARRDYGSAVIDERIKSRRAASP